jgi:hypothetical protein
MLKVKNNSLRCDVRFECVQQNTGRRKVIPSCDALFVDDTSYWTWAGDLFEVSPNIFHMSDLGTQQQSTPTDDQKAANRARFELELEFVQSLANPFYLQSLAQQNILEQPAFINFLEYLLYWQEKDYARFIQYVFTLDSANSAFNKWHQLPTCSSSPGAPSACSFSI